MPPEAISDHAVDRYFERFLRNELRARLRGVLSRAVFVEYVDDQEIWVGKDGPRDVYFVVRQSRVTTVLTAWIKDKRGKHEPID